jgi:hypothetical protein
VKKIGRNNEFNAPGYSRDPDITSPPKGYANDKTLIVHLFFKRIKILGEK